MITDEELLAACLSAGRPGSPAYREAWRLYRQAAAEWRERDTAWRQAAADSCQLPDGGTWRGYRQHRRLGAGARRACLDAWAERVAGVRAMRRRERAAAAEAERSREQAARALRESRVFAAHLAGELVLGRAA